MTLLLGFSTLYAASANEFSLDIQNNMNAGMVSGFTLLVTTTDTHSSMCGLQLTKMEITNPTSPLDADVVHLKDLKLEFSIGPHSMCMMAFGPHSGGAIFQIGQSLPSLSGLYNLVINGKEYGLLRVNELDGAILNTL